MIQVGDMARVTAQGKFKGQEVKIIAIEEQGFRHRRTSNWYLLDTIDSKYKWSYPYWFEAHEIEKVEAQP